MSDNQELKQILDGLISKIRKWYYCIFHHKNKYYHLNSISIAVILSKILFFSPFSFPTFSSRIYVNTFSALFKLFNLFWISEPNLYFFKLFELSSVYILSIDILLQNFLFYYIFHNPSQPIKINLSSFVLFLSTISGTHVTVLSKTGRFIFLNLKSPNPLETLSSPLILPFETFWPLF